MTLLARQLAYQSSMAMKLRLSSCLPLLSKFGCSHQLHAHKPRIPRRWFESGKIPRAPKVELFAFADFRKILPKKNIASDDTSQSLPLQDSKSSDSSKPLGEEPKSLFDSIKWNYDRYKEHVVLTQVGSFYELYFDHAKEYGPKLGLKVVLRKIGRRSDPETIYMAGFPRYQLDTYLKILCEELKLSVAVLDQYEKKSSDYPETVLTDKMKFDRRLTRIVSPGTLVNDSFINWKKNNYLLAIKLPQKSERLTGSSSVGLAWIDLGVGTFYYESTQLCDLASDISRINPREILIENSMKDDMMFDTKKNEFGLSEISRYYVSYLDFPDTDWPEGFEKMFDSNGFDVKLDDSTVPELRAVGGALKYIHERRPDLSFNLAAPQHKSVNRIMKIDAASRDALEIFNSLRGNSVVGTLFSALNKTVSDSGTRLLDEWMREPLLSIEGIAERQNCTHEIGSDIAMQTLLRKLISSTHDTGRLLQRFETGMNSVHDICKLGADLKIMEQIRDKIMNSRNLPDDSSLKKLVKRLHTPSNLSSQIVGSLNEELILQLMVEQEKRESEIYSKAQVHLENSEEIEGYADPKANLYEALPINPMKDKDEWLVAPSGSKVLTELHEKLDDLIFEKTALKKRFRSEYPLLTADLKWTPVRGFYMNIKGDIDEQKHFLKNEPLNILEPDNLVFVQHKTWSKIGFQILKVKEAIRNGESEVISEIKASIISHSSTLRKSCHILDMIDVFSSFAKCAAEYRLVKPKLSKSPIINIKNGRHLIVETAVLDEGIPFTGNDCVLGDKGARIQIITGPNMGGKSTYLRQNAIIILLSQIGSFVPADSAEIGIVDQIFCRIGARDDLSRGQSTFMMEMKETANILKNATQRSFAILDEVGRGTGLKDGLAIAYATLVHILQVNKCRAIFTTHLGLPLRELILEKEREMIKDLNKTSPVADDNIHQPSNEYKTQKFHFYCTNLTVLEPSNTSEYFSESNEMYIIDRKLVPGLCTDSNGRRIALQSRFPKEALQLSEKALQEFKSSRNGWKLVQKAVN